MKNSIKKEQFNNLWDMYKIAHKIDIAWQDYYNYQSHLFGGPGNGCDDYRCIDPTNESYLTNLMKKAKNRYISAGASHPPYGNSNIFPFNIPQLKRY